MIGNKITPPKILISMLGTILLSLASACAKSPERIEPAIASASDDIRHISGRLIAYTTPVGAREVNAAAIKPYHARWTTPGGVYEETLEVLDNSTWQHTQVGFRNNEGELIKVSTEIRTLSRADLRSLSWASEYHISSPQLPFKSVNVTVQPDGITGEMTASDGTKAPFNAPLPMPVFDGWIAGIAIAALPLKEGYWASLPTGTYIFQGAHHITVRVVGRTTIETAQGEAIDTWEVEAEWVDLGSGDIYEPGAAGAGGVYHIAVTPGKGVPHVVKYEAQSNPIMWDGIRRQVPN